MGDQQSKDEQQQGLVSGYTTEENGPHGGHTNRPPAHNRVPHRRAMPANSHLFDSSGESDTHSSSSSSGRRPRQKMPPTNVNFRDRRNPSNRIAAQSVHMSKFSSSVPDIASTNSPVDLTQTGGVKRPSRSFLSQLVYGGINENGPARSSSTSSGIGETFSQSTQNLNSSQPSYHQPKHSIYKKVDVNDSDVGLLGSQQVFSSTQSRSRITSDSVRYIPNEQQPQSRQSVNSSRNIPYKPLSQSRHTDNSPRNIPYKPLSQSRHMDNSPRNIPWQFQQMQRALQQLQASSNLILQEMDNEQRENEEWVSVIKKKATGIESRLQRMEDKAGEDEQSLTYLEDLVKTLCSKFDDLEKIVKTMSGQEGHIDKTVKKMCEQERLKDETVEAEPMPAVTLTESVLSYAEVENNEVQMIDLSTLPDITRDRKGYKDRKTERRQDNRRQTRKERRKNGRTVRLGQNGATTSGQPVPNIDKTKVIPKTPAQKIPNRQSTKTSSSPHTTEQRLPRLESISDAESTDSLLDSRNDYRNLAAIASGKRVLSSIEQETIPDSELYWRSLVEREKQAAKRSTLQKGNGTESFLVLDTSDSMNGQPFSKMIQAAKTLINGVFNHAELTHESICIVEVGQTTRVLVHLTNDRDKLLSALSQLRPGGMSPITGALLVVQELLNRNNSKIIVISDGKMTPIHIKSGQDLPELENEHQKVQLLLLSENLKKVNAKVYFVPVGPYDSSFMEGIVKATGGDEIEPDKIHRLGNWTRNTLLSLELAKEFKKQHPGVPINNELFMSMAEQVGSSLNTTPEDIVVDTPEASYIVRVGSRSMKNNMREQDIVMDASEGRIVVRVGGGSIKNNMREQELNDIVKIATDSEDSSCGYIECDPNMPPIGTRVRRGPDWRWGNQDIEMAGTIVSHTKNGYIWAEWDYGDIFRYRYGADGCYDVVTTEDPRLLHDDQVIAVGCVVKRGADWGYSHTEDSGSGNIGVVYIVHDDGSVQVRWSNGKMDKYKFGQGGCFEVEICDPLQQRLHLESLGASGGNLLGTELSSSLSKDTTKDDEIDPIVAEMNRRNVQRSKQKSETSSHDKQQDGDRDNIRTSKSSAVKTAESSSHHSSKRSSQRNSQSGSLSSPFRSQDSDNQIPKTKEREVPSSQTQQSTLKLVQKAEGVDKPVTAGTSEGAKSDIVIALKGQGIWQYKDGYGGWKSYDKEHSDKLEKGYCHHPGGASLLTIGKSSYRILFSKFKQVNTKTKEMIDVRRLVPQS